MTPFSARQRELMHLIELCLPTRLQAQDATAPPGRALAGLRADEHSGWAGFLLSTLPKPLPAQCNPWGSFSLTAAGQPRIFTEFPLKAEHGPSHQHDCSVPSGSGCCQERAQAFDNFGVERPGCAFYLEISTEI